MNMLQKVTGIALSLLFLSLLFFINQGLASFSNMLFPGTALWVLLALFALEGLFLLWFWRGIFGRRHHLLFPENQTEAEMEQFAEEFEKRLKKNPHINWEQLTKTDGDHTHKAMTILKEKADKEIKRTAERVFLATALSQNGKIDALIMFAALCRLVWRISGIYNQRPHPREIISLYSAVISSTFIALSLEELDITTEITVGFGETFNAMAPAAMTTSVPFVGAAMQKFTASVIDGTANCFLALRAGIITRDAYIYGSRKKKRSRVSVFKEAGGLLLGMSGSVLEQLTRTISGKVWGLTKTAQNATVNVGKTIAGGVKKAGTGIGDGVKYGVSTVGDGVCSSINAVGTGVSAVGGGIATGINKAGEEIAHGVAYIGDGIDTGASLLRNGIVTGITATGSGIAHVSQEILHGAEKIIVESATAVHATGSAAKKTGKSAFGSMKKLSIKAGKTVTAPFKRPFSEKKETPKE